VTVDKRVGADAADIIDAVDIDTAGDIEDAGELEDAVNIKDEVIFQFGPIVSYLRARNCLGGAEKTMVGSCAKNRVNSISIVCLYRVTGRPAL
jgi:hypothetical protein